MLSSSASVCHGLRRVLRPDSLGRAVSQAASASPPSFSTAAAAVQEPCGPDSPYSGGGSYATGAASAAGPSRLSHRWGLKRDVQTETGPVARASQGDHDQQWAAPPAGPSRDAAALSHVSPAPDALAHPARFYLLLACVYLLPRDAHPPRRPARPAPHGPIAGTAAPDTRPIAVPGPIAPRDRAIALLPPGFSAEAQHEHAMLFTERDAIRAVPDLLRMKRPRSAALRQRHLSNIYRYILILSPTRKWGKIRSSRHAALLALWKEFLDGLEELLDLDLVRPGRWSGKLGFPSYPDSFTPLVHLLTTAPIASGDEARDRRLRVHPPKDPPTIDRLLHVMKRLGHEPTLFQLTLLVHKLSLAELLELATTESTNGLLDKTANRLAHALMCPDSFDLLITRDLQTMPTDNHAQLKQDYRFLRLSIAEKIFDQFRDDQQPSEQWMALISAHRPLWIEHARTYARERSRPGAPKAPTRLQAAMLNLLLRDVLCRCPWTALRATPDVVGLFDLGDPLDILRLLLGHGAPLQQTATPPVVARATSAVVRLARVSAQPHRGLTPSVKLARLLAERRFPIPPRVAISYMGMAAQHPEDIVVLLPHLAKLRLDGPPTGNKLHRTARDLYRLARQADDDGLSASLDTTAQKGVATLFQKWGLELFPSHLM